MARFKCSWCKQEKDEYPIDMSELGLDEVCLICMQEIENEAYGPKDNEEESDS